MLEISYQEFYGKIQNCNLSSEDIKTSLIYKPKFCMLFVLGAQESQQLDKIFEDGSMMPGNKNGYHISAVRFIIRLHAIYGHLK